MTEEKEKQVPNIRKTLIKAIEDQILSKEELTKEEIATAVYDSIVSTLAIFMAQSPLQSRILNEARTLETAFGNSKLNINDFDVSLFAKPKTARAEFNAKQVNVQTDVTTEDAKEVINEPAQERNSNVGDK